MVLLNLNNTAKLLFHFGIIPQSPLAFNFILYLKPPFISLPITVISSSTCKQKIYPIFSPPEKSPPPNIEMTGWWWWWGGGGTRRNSWWGYNIRFSKYLPNFRPKKSFFTPISRPGFLNVYPFSDQTNNSHKRNRHVKQLSFLTLGCQQKIS